MGVKIVSLFDGMCCGMLAMLKANLQVDEYIAYEVDEYAIETSNYNFPNIKQCGDVFKADFHKHTGIDYVIGGSPCTYWSIAQRNNRETEASGLGWELFCCYVKAVKEIKPKFFIYENNKSMSNAIKDSITKTFGFEPICINSALVSAQNRQRLYWVGKRNNDGSYSKVNVKQPKDKRILLKDILINGYDLTSNDKSWTMTASYNGAVPWNTIERSQRNMVAEPVRVGGLPRPNGELSTSQAMRIYDINGKSVNLCSASGGMGAKTGLYAIPVEFENDCPKRAKSLTNGKIYTVYKVENRLITIGEKKYPIKLYDGYYIIRKLEVSECKKLQTVPDWYEFPVSDTQAYKMLGNGWTVDVIAHLINSTLIRRTNKCLKRKIKLLHL